MGLNMTDKKKRKERYEILFEDVNSKMDLVLEGYKEFGNKLDEAKQERDTIRDDLTKKIEFVASSLHNKIEEVRVDLSRRIDGTENKIEDTRNDLSKKIEGTEKRLEEKIVKIAYRLDDHEERIGVLEKKVSI